MITRLAPIPENGEKQREELVKMLHYIDPSINLISSSDETDVTGMAEWYKETFGVPGTPEFKENIRRINQTLQDDNEANSTS